MKSLDDWFEIPTIDRLQGAFDLIERVVTSQGDGAPTLGDVVELSAAAGMLGETAEDIRHYITGQMLAVAEAEHIIAVHPELAEKVASMAFQFTAAAASLLRGNIAVRHAGLGKRLAPLAEKNTIKIIAVERAKVIAAELWKADTAKVIRIGGMAEQVYRALAAEGFTDALPDTAERIKEWVKSAAPDYARKGGRSRKNPLA